MIRRALLAVALAPVLLVISCGDPNAGYAGEAEFARWIEAHPVEGYTPALVRGSNEVPFAGSLDILMVPDEPDDIPAADYESEITAVAAQVCQFEPESNVSVDYGYGIGAFSVPMTCPDQPDAEARGCGVGAFSVPVTCPDQPDAEARVADQAALLAELMTVRGVEGIEYFFTGSLRVNGSPGADLFRIKARVEEIAAKHAVALDDDDVFVSVRGSA